MSVSGRMNQQGSRVFSDSVREAGALKSKQRGLSSMFVRLDLSHIWLAARGWNQVRVREIGETHPTYCRAAR